MCSSKMLATDPSPRRPRVHTEGIYEATMNNGDEVIISEPSIVKVFDEQLWALFIANPIG